MAYGSVSVNTGVSQDELERAKTELRNEMSFIEMKHHAANPFQVTFENLDGVNLVKGIWNQPMARIEF